MSIWFLDWIRLKQLLRNWDNYEYICEKNLKLISLLINFVLIFCFWWIFSWCLLWSWQLHCLIFVWVSAFLLSLVHQHLYPDSVSRFSSLALTFLEIAQKLEYGKFFVRTILGSSPWRFFWFRILLKDHTGMAYSVKHRTQSLKWPHWSLSFSLSSHLLISAQMVNSLSLCTRLLCSGLQIWQWNLRRG